MGIVVDKDLKKKNKFVEVKRLGDRLVGIKLVLKEHITHTNSAYAAQARLDDSVKRQFW